MPKTNQKTNLPAPLSLTLEEASKVAAGSTPFSLAGLESWWWKGQPAFAILSPANINPGVVAGQNFVTH
jgi:hypothetical protein